MAAQVKLGQVNHGLRRALGHGEEELIHGGIEEAALLLPLPSGGEGQIDRTEELPGDEIARFAGALEPADRFRPETRAFAPEPQRVGRLGGGIALLGTGGDVGRGLAVGAHGLGPLRAGGKGGGQIKNPVCQPFPLSLLDPNEELEGSGLVVPLVERTDGGDLPLTYPVEGVLGCEHGVGGLGRAFSAGGNPLFEGLEGASVMGGRLRLFQAKRCTKGLGVGIHIAVVQLEALEGRRQAAALPP